MSQARATQHAVDPLFTDRWSPRAFLDQPIDDATLWQLFEAARWAPSGFNAQPWRFIYGRRGTAAWTPLFDALSPYNKSWAGQASALVLVLSRTQWVPPGKDTKEAIASHAFDTGAAWASLAFQAHVAGWQTHGIGGFDREAARQNLAVPPGHDLHAVVAIGRRGDKGVLPEALQAREQPNDRLPLSDLAAVGRLGFAA
jgi:nitroreductase